MKRLLVFAAVATFVLAARAEPPPPNPFAAMDWPASMTKAPNRFVSLGTFRIYFEQTTLSEVQRAVGVGSPAGAHDLWLCYTATHEGIRSRLWIISDGEMGGGSHVVTRFAAKYLTSEPPTPDCPDLPTRMEPSGVERAIWLLSSDEQLEKYVGTPSYKNGKWRAYTFQTKVPGRCNGGFDRLNWMTTEMDTRGVILIYAGQVTSC